ncbi:autotransporter assembly complex protein TamA [Candidatus Blochmannia ocreatus (nom. nud.)]|uniref:Translocation and assembly module subunit TamA n=1 Tax=Candidatus Blochmannia ocreatus (nom. nud.) TaxID=251538 RepID=A0ABY4SZB0_9ENTR|nr:autotransporter assembly complex family protein [Candidatus Blochmannia ocreatus]URJ25174.1 autotransporter assembly complex protein TamA [Candidatus Blochmannia ocreatus]
MNHLKRYLIGRFCVVICYFIPFLCNGNTQLRVEGLNSTLYYNVCKKLSEIDTPIKYVDEKLKKELENLVRLSLRPLGYYSPSVSFVLLKSLHQEPETLIIKIQPNMPIIITDVNISIYGAGKQDVDYQKIIKDSQFFVGKILNHDDYEQLKNKIYNLALFKGYFDANFQHSQLIVIPSHYKSIWNINFYSGPRYFFEDIQFQGNQIKEKYLRKISNIIPGNYYSAASIMELNRRLSSTNWFESISISSDEQHLQKKKIILSILLDPSLKNIFETGFGYTIDTGLRAKIIWKKPWINSFGHSLETNFSLSAVEQVLDLNYKIPIFCDPLEQYYLLQSGIVHMGLNNAPSSIINANIARYWKFSNHWNSSVNIHWYFNNCFEDGKMNKKILIYPGVNIYRIRKRGGANPYWGDSQYYAMHISHNFWKSRINFIAIQAKNVWVRTVLDKHCFLIKWNLAWINTKDFLFTAAVLRLFSNTDYGIRGYKYRSLYSYKNDVRCIEENIIKLIIATMEYQFHILKQCWGVVFLDAGEIANSIKRKYFNAGIGCGIRWKLPVGPIKLDIATPLLHNREEKKIDYQFLHLYISLGSDI